jgi:hypothetical protein
MKEVLSKLFFTPLTVNLRDDILAGKGSMSLAKQTPTNAFNLGGYDSESGSAGLHSNNNSANHDLRIVDSRLH